MRNARFQSVTQCPELELSTLDWPEAADFEHSGTGRNGRRPYDAAMTFGVFIHRPHSIYDDSPAERTSSRARISVGRRPASAIGSSTTNLGN